MNPKKISIGLPEYLSIEDKGKLSDAFDDFPSNLDSRIYTSFLKNKKTIF